MKRVQSMGRHSIGCLKCRQSIAWPEGLSATEKARLADISRRSRLEAVKFIRNAYSSDLCDAKLLAWHITGEPGRCHRCRSPVMDEISVCATCRSANLDW